MKLVIIGGSGLIGSKLSRSLVSSAKRAVARIAVGAPVNARVEIGGPEQFRGTELGELSLVPGAGALLGD